MANVTRMDISVHTGTHVDAPFHFLADGSTVETLSLKTLTGRAYVVHLPETDLITREVIESAGIPPRTRRVLFRTRNSEEWRNGATEFDEDYVALDAEGAKYLIKRGVKLVGVDGLSVAPFSNLVDTHNVLLKAGIVIVEGLDLSEVERGRYTLYCLPLKIDGADGAPARALLVGV
jgi:arylformamidase